MGGRQQTVSGTLTELVGQANKVTFVNKSAGAVYVTIKITGYHMDEGAAYSFQNVVSYPLNPNGRAPVAALSVPPGTYHVTFSATIANNSGVVGSVGTCFLKPSPGIPNYGPGELRTFSRSGTGSTSGIPVSLTGIVVTNGYFYVDCTTTSFGMEILWPMMVMTEVDEPHVH